MKRLWILALFIPAVALAAATHRPTGAWTECATGSAAAKTRDGVEFCYDMVPTAGADSPILQLTKLSSICFDADIGDATVVPASGQTVYIRRCFGAAVVAAECQKLLVDLDGGGITPADDLALNGDDGSTAQQRSCIYDVPPGYYYVDATGVPPAGDESRVLVRHQ